MNTTVINIRTDKQIKNSAQEIAEQLGFSLSSILNAYLRHFVKTKSVNFMLEPEIPNVNLKRWIKQAEKDYKEGKTVKMKSEKDIATFFNNI